LPYSTMSAISASESRGAYPPMRKSPERCAGKSSTTSAVNRSSNRPSRPHRDYGCQLALQQREFVVFDVRAPIESKAVCNRGARGLGVDRAAGMGC
jgi:hypothetical protein